MSANGVDVSNGSTVMTNRIPTWPRAVEELSANVSAVFRSLLVDKKLLKESNPPLLFSSLLKSAVDNP